MKLAATRPDCSARRRIPSSAFAALVHTLDCMELRQHWPRILNVLRDAKRSNRYFSIATVTPEGQPHVTPIGHVFFRADMTGYYFDAYSQAMPRNLANNPRICLMGVSTSTRLWLPALLRGQFGAPPGVRLFGEVSEPREATAAELRELAQSIRATRSLRGHKLLWSDLRRVRDLRFDAFAPVAYPVMCNGLWP
jgi:hypothetical protein